MRLYELYADLDLIETDGKRHEGERRNPPRRLLLKGEQSFASENPLVLGHPRCEEQVNGQ